MFKIISNTLKNDSSLCSSQINSNNLCKNIFYKIPEFENTTFRSNDTHLNNSKNNNNITSLDILLFNDSLNDKEEEFVQNIFSKNLHTEIKTGIQDSFKSKISELETEIEISRLYEKIKVKEFFSEKIKERKEQIELIFKLNDDLLILLFKRLSFEIKNYDIQIHLPSNAYNRNKTDEALNILKTFFKENYPNIKLQLFGSKATNLDIDDSDLDIVLFYEVDKYKDIPFFLKNFYSSGKGKSIYQSKLLNKIMEIMIDKSVSLPSDIRDIQCRIPIIKGKCRINNVEFDIR